MAAVSAQPQPDHDLGNELVCRVGPAYTVALEGFRQTLICLPRDCRGHLFHTGNRDVMLQYSHYDCGHFYKFSGALLASIMNMTGIIVDRYLAICWMLVEPNHIWIDPLVISRPSASLLLSNIKLVPLLYIHQTILRKMTEVLDVDSITIWGMNWSAEVGDLIQPHWKDSDKPSYAYHVIAGVISLILGIAAICGNTAVIYVFSRTEGLRNPSNALIVNLAVSDFCMMATLCPMFFASSLREKWIFGRIGCRFYGFSGALFGTASIMTMTGIAVDRYLAICKPFKILRNVPGSQRTKCIIIFVWIYSISWASPPLFGVSNYVLEGFLTSCSFDYLDNSLSNKAFILSMCVGAYALPLLIIGAAYGHISWKIRTSKHFRDRQERQGRTEKPTIHLSYKTSIRMAIHMAKVTFTTVVCWTIAWTPYAIVALLGVASYTTPLTPLAAQFPAVFAKSAAVYNPIVYVLAHRRYRKALRKKIYRVGHRCKKYFSTPHPGSMSWDVSHPDKVKPQELLPAARARVPTGLLTRSLSVHVLLPGLVLLPSKQQLMPASILTRSSSLFVKQAWSTVSSVQKI